MKKQFLSKTVFWAITLVFVAGCTTDDGVELNENGEVIDPGTGGQIVSGNPGLNDFIIASQEEIMYTVDAQTGQETAIYTFPDGIDFVQLPDYSNGKIFVTADDNSINALDVADKSFLWDQYMLEYNYSNVGATSTVCNDGVCYASGHSGVVVAVDESSGKLKWYYSTDPEGDLDNVLNENRTPIVYGDKVYVFSDEGFYGDRPPSLHILDKETGVPVKKLELPYEVTGTPLFVGNTMYMPAKNLYFVDLETFAINWKLEADGMGTPVISGDKLVVNVLVEEGIRSALYCLDLETKNIIWQIDTGVNTLWSPLIVENVVYTNYDKGALRPEYNNGKPIALDLQTGEQLWFNEDLSLDFSLVYANGILFGYGHDILRTENDEDSVGLLAIDANTGEALWLNPLFEYGYHMLPLVVADNGVFGPSFYRGKQN
ncbi:Outer membrane protein assembly factor BamB, contains PQQ-like beta-propeller repeat [Zobellia uliginosa]|uniref:Outer membrane protein assembly factor BamB, contains PQQ-like beta-propeller repeat n=1 Tax=Zobellia uliginosa TaxID=143224 RepID=A0ABY1KSE9_9FLAO|nr:PQQ-like beta-propeller repeat protein [Zobellia uliginosa]SIS53928.1 Outer membrane protein assembly factor BamB, contains PQQ-like beta-propeller repeat [Zobellia uliginosa]